MQSVVGVAMVPEAILEKLEPMRVSAHAKEMKNASRCTLSRLK